MEVLTVRSGLVEAADRVDVVAVDADGRELDRSGDPDHPLYYRSTVKPLQAHVALELGARLDPERLAVACSSHGGFPVHVGLVAGILEDAGLGEGHLRCPPAWPLAARARDEAHRRGERRPRRTYHPCSGKHAAWLAACVASGLPTADYLDPSHPLQRRVAEVVADATGVDPTPCGVDGCGAPTWRGTVRGLARAFARLLDDHPEPAAAMSRFPALVADALRPDGRLAMWWGGPVKVGAAGLVAAGRFGVGLAAKSRAGRADHAVVALIRVARRLGLLTDAMRDDLGEVVSPPVWGGDRVVGSVEVRGS